MLVGRSTALGARRCRAVAVAVQAMATTMATTAGTMTAPVAPTAEEAQLAQIEALYNDHDTNQAHNESGPGPLMTPGLGELLASKVMRRSVLREQWTTVHHVDSLRRLINSATKYDRLGELRKHAEELWAKYAVAEKRARECRRDWANLNRDMDNVRQILATPERMQNDDSVAIDRITVQFAEADATLKVIEIEREVAHDAYQNSVALLQFEEKMYAEQVRYRTFLAQIGGTVLTVVFTLFNAFLFLPKRSRDLAQDLREAVEPVLLSTTTSLSAAVTKVATAAAEEASIAPITITEFISDARQLVGELKACGDANNPKACIDISMQHLVRLRQSATHLQYELTLKEEGPEQGEGEPVTIIAAAQQEKAYPQQDSIQEDPLQLALGHEALVASVATASVMASMFLIFTYFRT